MADPISKAGKCKENLTDFMPVLPEMITISKFDKQYKASRCNTVLLVISSSLSMPLCAHTTPTNPKKQWK